MAEEKLAVEAKEERLALEEDKRQRLLRKQRIAEEMTRARRDKAATKCQTAIRGKLARTKLYKLSASKREADKLEAERVEKERLAAIENRHRRREHDGMLDADLETMAFINEERFLCERERDHMASQEECGIFLQMDPGGYFEGEQGKIAASWAERNRETRPEDWAVFEDGDSIDEEAEEAAAKAAGAGELPPDYDSDTNDKNDERDERKEEKKVRFIEGSEEKQDVESVRAKSPASPLTVTSTSPSSSSTSSGGDVVKPMPMPRSRALRIGLREAMLRAHPAAAAVATVHFRQSVLSSCLGKAAKPVCFRPAGVQLAGSVQTLPFSSSSTISAGSDGSSPQQQLRSSPPPQEPVPVQSPRVGMRLVPSRGGYPPAAPSNNNSAGGAGGGSLEDVPDKAAVFSQKLPSAGVDLWATNSTATSTAAVKGSALNDPPKCALSHALCEFKAWHSKVRGMIEDARRRYEEDRGMEQKFGGDKALLLAAETAPDLTDEEQRDLQALDVTRDPSKVTTLELKVEGLNSASFLRIYPNITTLVLNVNRLRSLEGLQYMSGLQHLSAKDNQLTDISALAGTSGLKSVSLDDNQLVDLSALGDHRGLQRLTVNNNALQTLHSLAGANFPRLQRLEAYQNRLTNVPEGALRGLISLTYLDLGRNKLEWISGDALSQCVHLQTIVLSQNSLTEVPSPLRLPHLQVLWLSNNSLKDLQPWVPSATGTGTGASKMDTKGACFPFFCPMLEKLHLQDNSITAVHPAALLLCLGLRHVDLSFNGIASPSDLEGLAACPDLRHLQLGENPATTTSQVGSREALLEWVVVNLHSLLNVGDDTITDELRAHFSKAIRAAQTEHLMSDPATTFSTSMGTPPPGCSVGVRVRRALQHQGFLLPSSSSATNDFSKFDVSLVQLLSAIRLEEQASRTREKLRKRQVEIAIKGGEPRESAEVTVGPGEEAHCDALLESFTQRLLAWPEHTEDGLPMLVKLSARLNEGHRDNDLPTLQNWQGTLSERMRGKNRVHKEEIAAMMLQATIRGFTGRRRLARAIAASHYHDEEIDLLMDAPKPQQKKAVATAVFAGSQQGGQDDLLEASFDLDEFLSEGIDIPELASDYFVHDKHRPPTTQTDNSKEQQKQEEDRWEVEEEEAGQQSRAPPMVYGDHRSHKKAQRLMQESQKHRQQQQLEHESTQRVLSAQSEVTSSSAGGNVREMFSGSQLQPSSWTDEGRMQQQDLSSSITQGLTGASPDGRRPVLESAGDGDYSATGEGLDRPMSAMTDTSDIDDDGVGDTPRSRHGDGMLFGSSLESPGAAVGVSLLSGQGQGQSRKQAQQADQLASEWGIKDPKVLALMVKRSRKTGNQPQGRAAVARGASGMSAKMKSGGGAGAFGGKPKTNVRGTNRTAGRKGVPPAWAKPELKEDG
jgi:Leucine-rich repeat (LRR) protein